MTETPLQRNIRFVRAMIESNQDLITARDKMIESILASAPVIEANRQRMIELAMAGADLQSKHEMLTNAAVSMMGDTANLDSKIADLERTSGMLDVKWAQSLPLTVSLLDKQMASIGALAGVDLGMVKFDKLMKTTEQFDEELPATPDNEAEIDALLEMGRPGLTAEIEKLELLVDFKDPKHRRAIVWSVKILFYFIMLFIITSAGGADTIELSDFLNNMGVSPMKIADFSGEWVGTKMDKSGHADDEEGEH